MSSNPEFIGRAKVIETRKHGEFVLKVLEPEMVGTPLEPNSKAAQDVLERIKPKEKTEEEKANYKPKAPSIPYNSTIGGRKPE